MARAHRLGRGEASGSLPVCAPAQRRGRRRLRTTNALERVNKEIKRRTRVATRFPSEASCERLVTAVAMEISEEWVTGRTYLNMSEAE